MSFVVYVMISMLIFNVIVLRLRVRRLEHGIDVERQRRGAGPLPHGWIAKWL